MLPEGLVDRASLLSLSLTYFYLFLFFENSIHGYPSIYSEWVEHCVPLPHLHNSDSRMADFLMIPGKCVSSFFFFLPTEPSPNIYPQASVPSFHATVNLSSSDLVVREHSAAELPRLLPCALREGVHF